MPKKREKPVPIWSERVANLRHSTGLTQRDFAAELKISAGTVKRLEVGDLPLTNRLRDLYAGHFQCAPGYITGETKYRDRAEEVAEKMAEGVKESSEEERVRMEGRTAVWKAAERWIRASFPDESLEELEAQGRINLFEIFCSVTDCVQEAIWKAKI